jgi:putative FmdB family regulatory protein
MPFYEYHCANCGHHHEELQKVTDKPLRKCPACGKNKLSRLISAPVFRLKGGGWYETDFKSDKESKRNLAGEKEHAEPKSEAADKPKDAGKKDDVGKTVVPVSTPAKAKPVAKKAATRKTRAAGSRAK